MIRIVISQQYLKQNSLLFQIIFSSLQFFLFLLFQFNTLEISYFDSIKIKIYLMSLIITPISAKLLRDQDHLGKMDPYLALELGKQKVKGKQLKNAGKEPKWNEENLQLKVPIGCSDNLKIIIMDSDLIKDDLVCQCQINVSAWTKDYFPKTQQLQLLYKKKPAGSIIIKHAYNLAGNQNPGKGPNDQFQPGMGGHQFQPNQGGQQGNKGNQGNQGNQGGGF